ncbi:hypothetical protein ACTXOR_10505 [Arthrobacter rhombi]|uniref:hypothetical protein n=1 Tax=Arthrobacter rhombi TaxID=71253 RepID=UPI003FD3A2DA
MSRQIDVYYRLEVINDVLDRDEAHLGFLHYSNEHDYASVLTPVMPTTTGTIPRTEKEPHPRMGLLL